MDDAIELSEKRNESVDCWVGLFPHGFLSQPNQSAARNFQIKNNERIKYIWTAKS